MQSDAPRKVARQRRKNPLPRTMVELEAWAIEVQRRKLAPAESEALAGSFRWLRSWRFEDRLSVLIPASRPLSYDERQRLRKLAEDSEFAIVMSDTICGVTLWIGQLSRQEFKALLDDELREQILMIVPEVEIELVYDPGWSIFGRLLQKARKGNRYAARRLASHFKSIFPWLLDNYGLDDVVRAMARVSLHLERAQRDGDRPNKSADKALRLLYLERLAKRGLRGLPRGRDHKEFLSALALALRLPKLRPEDERAV